MKQWETVKKFYWPLAHSEIRKISAEGQAEFKEKQKAWAKGKEYVGPRDIWREHSDRLIRQNNRRVMLPVINKYIYRSLFSGAFLLLASGLAEMYDLTVLKALCFLDGFCFFCLGGFLIILRNDGIKAGRSG